MRIDESSPLMYVLIVVVAVVLVGVALAMYWSELAGLVRSLGST